VRTLYIARPIDHAQSADVTQTIAKVVSTLKEQVLVHSAVLTFDPNAAFTVGSKREVSPELQEINNKAIHSSDAMLVFAPVGVKSWGVPAEVELAHTRGMNIAIVTDGKGTWAMPSGRNVRYFGTLGQMGGLEGWLDGACAALSWLTDAPLPRFTNNGRNGSERTLIQFAPIEGVAADKVKLPTRAYSDDAGLDLYTTKGLWVGVGEFVDVPTSLRMQLPPWAWGFLVGRSSTLRKHKLMVNPGIIDTGYRGELFIGVQNLGDKPVRIDEGMRLAQLIVMGNATRRVNPVMEEDLEPHQRGHAGFGSSGV
jgi:dUTP pyrophosphatase